MGTRRDFIKKTAYAAPVVLTMVAKPSFASSGSNRQETTKTKRSKDKKGKSDKKKGKSDKKKGKSDKNKGKSDKKKG